MDDVVILEDVHLLDVGMVLTPRRLRVFWRRLSPVEVVLCTAFFFLFDSRRRGGGEEWSAFGGRQKAVGVTVRRLAASGCQIVHLLRLTLQWYRAAAPVGRDFLEEEATAGERPRRGDATRGNAPSAS